ncbi:pilus assembly protein PilM [bacterium]|nr:pilus assembly protein PilM [bacterium]
MAKKVLGIHIGEHRIICVEAKVGGNVVAEKIGIVPLPELAVVNGIIAKPKEVLEVMEGLITRMEISTNNAIINIPPNLSLIKCIPYEENYLQLAEDQIKWELSHHFNEPLDDYLVSAFSLSMTTVLVGVREESVQMRVSVAEKMGLSVLATDPDPVALFNLFATFEGAKPKKNYIITHIEVPFSSVVFFSKGDFWYGGHLFTPPELFGLGEGKRSWREFGEDLTTMLKLSVEAYRIFNPLFEPETIYFTGRKLPEDTAQSVSSQIGASIGDISDRLRKKNKLKPKKGTIEPQEGVIALGLAAHGSTLL